MARQHTVKKFHAVDVVEVAARFDCPSFRVRFFTGFLASLLSSIRLRSSLRPNTNGTSASQARSQSTSAGAVSFSNTSACSMSVRTCWARLRKRTSSIPAFCRGRAAAAAIMEDRGVDRLAALHKWLGLGEGVKDIEAHLPKQPASDKKAVLLPLLVTFIRRSKYQTKDEDDHVKCIVLGTSKYVVEWSVEHLFFRLSMQESHVRCVLQWE